MVEDEMNAGDMKEPTKAELVETVNELSGLVTDMRGLLDSACDLCDQDGWLRRHMGLRGIRERMEALGFEPDGCRTGI